MLQVSSVSSNFTFPDPICTKPKTMFKLTTFPKVHYITAYSLPQKKVYTFVEPSTQNWGGLDEKYGWVCRTPYFSPSSP